MPGEVFYFMPLNKLSKLRMYAEVRYHSKESLDSLTDVEDLTKDYSMKKINKDEIHLIQKNNSNNAEIRVKPSRFLFVMDPCPSYEFFVEVLEDNIKRISSFLPLKDIVCTGVQGYYLYPIDSIQEFSTVVASWSGSYMDENTTMQISDIGVSVYFREENIKININCRFITSGGAKEYFPKDDQNIIQNMNLLIEIDISTENASELNKSFPPFLVAAIKVHINQAIRVMEEKLAQILKK